MLAPSIYSDLVSDLFNGFGDFFKLPTMFESRDNVYGISTDVEEFDDHYELDMELPGYNKDNIKAELKDGYLKISAEHEQETEEEGKERKFVRKERFYGKVSRSFFVGKDVKKEQIKAEFENGILSLTIPKVVPEPEKEEDNNISIF